MRIIGVAFSLTLVAVFAQANLTRAQENRNPERPVQAATPIPAGRAPVKCMEDSPERRGEEGCTILASRPLRNGPTKSVYWHIDRFDSLHAAKKAAGPDGVAAEAHGLVWLMTVEAKGMGHHGGRHVAWIGPLVLPVANHYSMRVQSSLLRPETRTPVHTHSGPEVFFIVSGEQCLETREAARRLIKGQSLILPADVIHRGRVVGSNVRRALALVLHDAARPTSTDLADPPELISCTSEKDAASSQQLTKEIARQIKAR